jgi:hypothetical protein
VALVRRKAVDGRQSPAVPVPGSLTVPRQPSAADMDDASLAASAAGTTGGVTPGNGVEEMAAAPDRPVRLWAIGLGLGFVAGGGALAFYIDELYAVPTLPVSNPAAAIAALLLFAVVVERLLEPFTRWLPGRRARQRYEQRVADLANHDPQVTLASVAAAKAQVEQHRAERALLAWGLASAVATVLAAGAGFYLLRILVIADDAAWDVVWVWVDALATGLIVGSATKPVHDLFTRLRQQNAQRRDPTEA